MFLHAVLYGSNPRLMSIIKPINNNDINLKVLKCNMQNSKQLCTQNTQFIQNMPS